MGYTNSLFFDGLLHKHEYSEDSVLKGALSSQRQFLTTASPLKMLFISPLKLFSFSRYLDFCLEFSVMRKTA